MIYIFQMIIGGLDYVIGSYLCEVKYFISKYVEVVNDVLVFLICIGDVLEIFFDFGMVKCLCMFVQLVCYEFEVM